MITIPLEIGDIILTGKFKNKKVQIKELGTDQFGNPTANGKSIMSIRIPKLYQEEDVYMKGTIKLSELNSIIEKVTRKVLTELDVNTDELEKKAERYAELANKMKVLEAELKSMEKEYGELDDEFRQMLEAVGQTKDTFIRANKLIIKIERASYPKKSTSYKTGFDYLYEKVNGKMKELADEALKLTQTTSIVKSKISVVKNENQLIESKLTDWFKRFWTAIKSKTTKLLSKSAEINSDLDKLEKMI